jgi:four helix bundle protein
MIDDGANAHAGTTGNGSGNDNSGPGSSKLPSHAFDLHERTALFGEAIIAFGESLPVNVVTRHMITQMVNSGTSVGANYAEANEGVSKKDFRNKIGICKKEASETKYWLRMMASAAPALKETARPLWQEAKELHLIFAKIFRSCDSRHD